MSPESILFWKPFFHLLAGDTLRKFSRRITSTRVPSLAKKVSTAWAPITDDQDKKIGARPEENSLFHQLMKAQPREPEALMLIPEPLTTPAG